ncbi:unnamed protein product [Phytophthora fragariaefolia]|uniref:Unnamed protein product n=1 Tax=Phytophthora fragariaefolia TaxID=1490495 RepID=A0A9W7CWS4_9STRA|nr:unnamed protein product [Phytophthora fragariaefolia]
MMVDLNRRPPLRIDYELDRRFEAAESLSDVVDALAPISRLPASWEDEISELRDDVTSLEARLAASETSLRRKVDLRLKAERLCNQASRYVVVSTSLADTHKVIRQDRQNFKTGIASYAAQLRQLREYLERNDRQSSASNGAGSAMPAAFVVFREELGALQLTIPSLPAAFGSSEASAEVASASSASSGCAADASGSSTALPLIRARPMTLAP